MNINKRSSEQIKSALLEELDQIKPSDELFNKIKADINNKECEKVMKNKMTKFKKGKRLTVLVASFVLLFSITVLGVTMGKSWLGTSNHKYKSFPSQEKILNDVGFIPKYTESLPGGFKYFGGGTGESKLSDESGNTLTQTKDIDLGYKRENEKSVLNLSISQIEEQFLDDNQTEIVGDLNGVSLYYSQQDYKFVPADYKVTEEDKKAEKEGKLVISYGAPEISIENVQHLSWYEDGLHYTIIGNDYNFKVQEMIDMASVVINK